jgi:hypothetical protein
MLDDGSERGWEDLLLQVSLTQLQEHTVGRCLVVELLSIY